jgi:hypothetical protein
MRPPDEHARSISIRSVKLVVLAMGAATLCAFFIPTSSVIAARQTPEKGEFFESRVRPLLIEKCYSCHTTAEKGGLRLDSKHALISGGKRGPAVVPGNPDESLLIQAVRHTHPELRMPMGSSKLTAEEVGYLAQWIKDGAFWPESPAEFFNTRIKPLLARNCWSCHTDGPGGGLRLDSREALLKGGVSGPAVIPGDADRSLIVQAVRQSHDKLRMPPIKRLDEGEIADLIRWVKEGAVWAETPAASASPGTKLVITPEQRAFWSFQAVKDHKPPSVKNRRWPRTDIDRFILARLEGKGIDPTSDADKRTLIRRATFDLIGLPPTPDEVEAFLRDKSPDSFNRVVERLLGSPHYGERWGRHWLDLVRYADSAGDSADYPIPQAYRYRDYVIDSLNRDKPYDQFIREQLAGDLLPANSEAQKWEQTIATGYLAMSRRFSVRPERQMHLTIEDTIDNLGKTFLGLAINCARCHDHKYDPISSEDYYALYGIFDSTRYPFAGSENIQEQRDLVLRLPKSEADGILKPYVEQLAPLDAELKRLQDEKKALEEEAQTDGEQPATRKESLRKVNAAIAEVKKARVTILLKMPNLESAFAVAEAPAHNARIHKRGDPRALGEEAPRRFLQILGGHALPPGEMGSGRLQLAEWLTDARGSLTARVMVNRIWQHHFGEGLVSTPSDFGKRGSPPTHPELLDHLAKRFTDIGWSIKAMHRLIMTSRVYRLASIGRPRNSDLDPANKLLWKFNRRRLDAETIRDSMLMVSGKLDLSRGGPHPFPHFSSWAYTQHRPFAAVYESRRRSVYLMVQRIQKHPYLSIFDGPDTNLSTAQRGATTTPIQALFMMNSAFVHEQAEGLAARLMAASADDRGRIELAYRIALGRPPTRDETSKAVEHLRASHAGLAALEEGQRPLKALASFLRPLLASNEFIYVD